MPLELFFNLQSPPCRAVLLTTRVLELNLVLTEVNIAAGEHITPQFLQINPQHSVPTLLEDDGFSLSEGRAIAAYLVNQYGADDSLYPRDPKKRAAVDQALYFDAGILYRYFSRVFYPVMYGGGRFTLESMKCLKEALQILDGLLTSKEWVAGDAITIADFFCVSTVSSIKVLGIDLSCLVNVVRWMKNCRRLIPDYKRINEDGAFLLREDMNKACCFNYYT